MSNTQGGGEFRVLKEGPIRVDVDVIGLSKGT